MAQVRSMHQTTIRFSRELWDRLELVAEQGGVSVAQYVREAAIERLARTGALTDFAELPNSRITDASRDLEATRQAARALGAESRQARTRAQQLLASAELARER